MAEVFADLETRADALERLVGRLAGDGWTVARHFRQLIRFSRLVVRSVEQPSLFPGTPDEDFSGATSTLPSRWRSEHRKATEALSACAPDVSLPWLGGALRPSVLAAAALTELFARTQDVTDGLGVRPQHDDSVGHVAYYGVRTRDRAYTRRGVAPPASPFRFEFVAPSGTEWRFGPADADQRVSGPAVDFCLLVTRRRTPAELSIVAQGKQARQWLDIADATEW